MKIAKLFIKGDRGYLKVIPFSEASDIQKDDVLYLQKTVYIVDKRIFDFDSNELSIILIDKKVYATDD